MNQQNDNVLKDIIQDYFKRLSILVTQIPLEIRRLLLPPYMLYLGFKSIIHVDPTGRIGFEIYRERASRFSIKTRKTNNRVEEEIFGILGQENMFRFTGHDTELKGGILTCKDFVDKFKHDLPKDASTLNFTKPGKTGPIEICEEAEVKIIGCGIYWMTRNKRFVKHVPFAWLFGNDSYFSKIDPFLHAESDFYSSLFASLYWIITQGYEKFDEETRSKVFQTYVKLIEKVSSEFKKQFASTQADEYVFQQLLTRYKFFLSPGAMLIESQPTLRREVSRKPDFHVQLGRTEHVYIEIEPPFCKPFIGAKQSSRLKTAVKQVSEWKEILVKQVMDGEIVHYMIIIGLLQDLNKVEKETLQAFNAAQDNLILVTWDWVLDNVKKIKREMMTKLKVSPNCQ